MTIKLVENPIFTVDFKQFIEKEKQAEHLNLRQRVSAAAAFPFYLIKCFFIALAKAAYVTFKNSGVSFKYIVLGYYGSLRNFSPPADIYLAVFKVAFWILGMGWCLTKTTTRLFLERVAPDSPSFSYLSNYSGNEIDVSHIKTSEVDLDISTIPDEIKIDNLAQMFDEINFADEKAPGYIGPASRQEGVQTYEIDELKKSLETFIEHLKKRKAFLGTPPIYDVPRLMDFYQQIESTVLLSIFKVQAALVEFKKSNGEDSSQYDENGIKQYESLLEDQARLVVNLAIAGKHCAIRYVLNSVNSCYQLHGESSIANATLRDALIELLSHKRREIAQSQIFEFHGTNTDVFNKYMANLGKLLGIPGTENIVEHLDPSIDRDKELRRFFEAYTVDAIIDTIQDKIKTSESLRKKVVDWVKGQIGDWKKEEYEQKANEALKAMEKVLEEKNSPSFDIQEFVNKGVCLDKEVIGRVLDACKEKKDWRRVMRDHLDLDRRREFLEELNLHKITQNGVSKEVLEWILVSQKILLPQKGIRGGV